MGGKRVDNRPLSRSPLSVHREREGEREKSFSLYKRETKFHREFLRVAPAPLFFYTPLSFGFAQDRLFGKGRGKGIDWGIKGEVKTPFVPLYKRGTKG
jgi:hypothetical protein